MVKITASPFYQVFALGTFDNSRNQETIAIRTLIHETDSVARFAPRSRRL